MWSNFTAVTFSSTTWTTPRSSTSLCNKTLCAEDPRRRRHHSAISRTKFSEFLVVQHWKIARNCSVNFRIVVTLNSLDLQSFWSNEVDEKCEWAILIASGIFSGISGRIIWNGSYQWVENIETMWGKWTLANEEFVFSQFFTKLKF